MKNSRIAHAMQFVGDDLIAEACTHTSPRHSRLLLAAACAALVLLGGVGCAVYRAYWGAGSAADIPPADLTRPFETGSEAVASGEEPPPPAEEVTYPKSSLIADYTNVYAVASVCVPMEGAEIPATYFSPNYMVIFTRPEEAGWVLAAGDTLSIEFTLAEGQTCTLDLGYIQDGVYHDLSSARAAAFSDTLTAPADGTYYFCVTNRTSENAVIQGGSIR